MGEDPSDDVLRQAGLLGYKPTLDEVEQLLSTGLCMSANWRCFGRANSGTVGALPPTLTLTNFLNHHKIRIINLSVTSYARFHIWPL